ncbi:hypothetical protein EXIGLDRAFT_761120 [Exidia glandulosa HHB12029]|uniref:Uncharacterized protein n=1 Tax=Exidia glandulosa HHB12029 TaxID=1314781 RepID=A0A165NRF4_EXIGL|nr:hypothetical protein EXIGLDRAFT_761120 [Exidia glandulosa HHB12029]
MADNRDFDFDEHMRNQYDDEFDPNPGDPNRPSTLLEARIYCDCVEKMSKAPGTVFTFDKDTNTLVPWLWPKNPHGALVQPNQLDTVLKKHDIEYPFCLCIYKHNDKLVSRPAVLKKVAGKLLFACRLTQNACDFTVALDEWNSEVTVGAPMEKLAAMRGVSFQAALEDENYGWLRDVHSRFYGSIDSAHAPVPGSSTSSSSVKNKSQQEPKSSRFLPYRKASSHPSSLQKRSSQTAAAPFDPLQHLPRELVALLNLLMGRGVSYDEFKTYITLCNGCNRFIAKSASSGHVCDLTL